MPPLSLHLGTINVTSSVFNLQLDSASIMELESSVALGYSLTDIKPIEMLTSREAWVTRGVGCRISIQLWIDGERPSDERWRADTAETLGRVLKEAEWWKQLQLQVTLSVPNPSSASLKFDHEDIVIHIKNMDGLTSYDLGRKHTRAASSSASCNDPPFGVPCVELNMLRIKLDFSTVYPSEQRKRAKLDSYPDLVLHNLANPQSETTNLRCTSWHLRSAVECPARSKAGSDPLCLRSETALVAADLGCSHASESMALPSLLMKTNGLCSSLESPPAVAGAQGDTSPLGEVFISRRDDYSDQRKRQFAHELDCDDASAQGRYLQTQPPLRSMIELMDVAIRSLISYRPSAGPNLRTSKDQLSPSLSAIAPALWSPGYLPAITQRSHGISTITRALYSISRRCRSSSLSQKLAEISRLPLSPISSSAQIRPMNASSRVPEDDEQHESLKRVLRARLWRLLQQGVYDPSAALSLQPLQLSSKSASDDTCIGHEHEQTQNVQGGSREDIPSNTELNVSTDGKPPDSLNELEDLVEDRPEHSRSLTWIPDDLDFSEMGDYNFAYDYKDDDVRCPFHDASELSQLAEDLDLECVEMQSGDGDAIDITHANSMVDLMSLGSDPAMSPRDVSAESEQDGDSHVSPIIASWYENDIYSGISPMPQSQSSNSQQSETWDSQNSEDWHGVRHGSEGSSQHLQASQDQEFGDDFDELEEDQPPIKEPPLGLFQEAQPRSQNLVSLATTITNEPDSDQQIWYEILSVEEDNNAAFSELEEIQFHNDSPGTPTTLGSVFSEDDVHLPWVESVT